MSHILVAIPLHHVHYIKNRSDIDGQYIVCYVSTGMCQTNLL